ncbi:MAG: P1 family peptidase [Deltaproteobacteria bacterium]|nr:P1 family peptidase [Deltaproteobacteria bacterium]MBI3293615.1 P1 family peptidase [Deltaproteobacteria bacterium]
MRRTILKIGYFLIPLVCSAAFAAFQTRDLGLKLGNYSSGKRNQITDVKGVTIGHVTLNAGAGKLQVGKGPIRTGVTVVMPGSADPWSKKVIAASSVLNGNGEAMGKLWVDESGVLESPIVLTNTLSVAAAQLGVIEWNRKLHPEMDAWMPVVLECDDSSLNDIGGFHVKSGDIQKAIESGSDSFEEGSVGAGTGMISFDFKSGIGSASRIIPLALNGKEKRFTVAGLGSEDHQPATPVSVNLKFEC